MKAGLYAVESHARWNWYCTLDSRIDRFMRFRLYDADTRLIWLEPALSLGQAVWLADRLNERSYSGSIHLDHIRRELISNLAELGGLTGLKLGRERFRHVRLHSYCATALAEHSPPLDEASLRMFNAMLEGKALLPEEVQSALAGLGQEAARGRWTSYAQAAALSGAAVLTNGVELTFRRKLLRRKPVWACKRCGSEGASIVWAPCPHCGGLCPYCESCLAMGRSRFCTPLLLGRERTDRSRFFTEAETIDLGKWRLSPAQKEASAAGIRFLSSTDKQEAVGTTGHVQQRREPPCFLIWAVTGAGKTEMIFPHFS